MWEQIWPGLRIKLFMTLVLGVAYPLALTAVCQVLFPRLANGSLVTLNGGVIGSELIGQQFSRPEYFHPRPSAAGNGYDATASAGSNYGPTNQKLIDRVKASLEAFRKENPDYSGPVPADLLTASASGLDPHISPDAARAQAVRIAKARGLAVDQVTGLIDRLTEPPQFGLLGESRINVFRLNLALDRDFPRR